MQKHVFTLLLVLIMVFGLLPVTALALTDSEPNDTLATAQKFTMGDTISGVISENEDADWYKFTLDAAGRISFKFTSYMEHYSVWLYDNEGTALWDSYGNTANPDTGMRADTYDIDLIEGTYYLKVSGQHGSGYNVGYSSGNYTLTTSYFNANVDEVEPNDTILMAQQIPLDGVFNGQCALNNREDYFKIKLPADGQLTLTVTSYMDNYSVWLFDSDGNEIWADYGNSRDSEAISRKDTFTLHLVQGTYYLKMSGQHGSGYNVGYSSGNYTLTSSYSNANVDETEPNDTMLEAQQIPLDGVFNGQCALNNREDYFKIKLPADGQLTLTVTSYMDNYSVWLFDSDGNEIWADYGNSRDSEAISRKDTFTLHLVQGTYFLKVSGQHGSGYNVGYSSGNYTLTTSYSNANVDETEPNDTMQEAQPIPLNRAFHGQCALNNTHDYYMIELPADRELSLTFTSYMNYYSVWLFDSDGNEIWADYGNIRDSEAISRKDTFTLDLVQGTYYLKVSGQHGSGYNVGYSSGNYTIKLNTENPFDDVPSGSWFEDPVLWALENGITTGSSETTFSPGDKCLRAHVVTFLWNAEKCPEPAAAASTFTDVPAGAWYEKPVLWAVENGITSGTSATKFGAGDVCSRYQVVFFLWKAAGSPEPKTTVNPFTDVNPGHFFYKAVLWAVENGITSGTSATTFGPTVPCNRAQVVTFLYAAYN